MPEPSHGSTEPRGLDAVSSSVDARGRFGRMFRGVPTVKFDDAVLKEIAADMVDKPDASGRDNPVIPAGYTYLGQFIDHDITFDPVSALGRLNDPDALVDFRTPRLDLDSLYGAGPAASPHLYDRTSAGGVKLLIGQNPDTDTDGESLERDDLPRNEQGLALIGDPRNDENIIVSQLHLTFIRFHNKVVDLEAKKHDDPKQVFKHANRRVRWHYQWVVIRDFLPRIAGPDILDEVFPEENGVRTPKLQFYKPDAGAFMPVEFSAAAYRFGHSMIRPTYSINTTVQGLPIFLPKGKPGPRDDFHGFRRLPSLWTVDWSFFFKTTNRKPQASRKIDTKLAVGLGSLPGETGDMRKLPLRNLRRGNALQLPPGGRVANAVGAPELTASELGRSSPVPLWFYILKEAEVREGGAQLGPTGARIVAETLVGLLAADPLSYLNVEPTWQPKLGPKVGEFTMADLVNFVKS